MSDLDKFGGWKAKRFDATGFFRKERDCKSDCKSDCKRDGDRWWLVTPEGNAFISLGINHYHGFWWDQDYNRDLWKKRFGGEGPKDPHWVDGYRKSATSDMAHLGLSTLGIHTDELLLKPTATHPYVARFEPVQIPHYKVVPRENFPDVFSEDFDALCDEVAKIQVEPIKDDPYVLGFSMTDCPIFTDEDAQKREMTVYGAPREELSTWPKLLRNLGQSAPGKQAYVKTMQTRYEAVSEFNNCYGTEFGTWENLLIAENWRENTDYDNQQEIQDNSAFLRECVDTYYAKARVAFRRYDQNHLFFGDKLNANSDGLKTVIDITTKYTDIVFYQMYARYSDQIPVLELISKTAPLPIINGDSAYSVQTEMLPNPYGPHAADQVERAAWTKEFAEGCFSRPEFVGWHICGILDTWKIMSGKEGKQHSGLMTPIGSYYAEMEDVIIDISARLYNLH